VQACGRLAAAVAAADQPRRMRLQTRSRSGGIGAAGRAGAGRLQQPSARLGPVTGAHQRHWSCPGADSAGAFVGCMDLYECPSCGVPSGAHTGGDEVISDVAAARDKPCDSGDDHPVARAACPGLPGDPGPRRARCLAGRWSASKSGLLRGGRQRTDATCVLAVVQEPGPARRLPRRTTTAPVEVARKKDSMRV
jgi:hypothetical protein